MQLVRLHFGNAPSSSPLFRAILFSAAVRIGSLAVRMAAFSCAWCGGRSGRGGLHGEGVDMGAVASVLLLLCHEIAGSKAPATAPEGSAPAPMRPASVAPTTTPSTRKSPPPSALHAREPMLRFEAE